MKNGLIVILFCFLISQIKGQSSKTELFFEAGYNSSHFTSIKYSGNSPAVIGDHSQNINSFNTGLIINVPLKKNFYLQSGLSLTGKGGKTQIGGYFWFYEKDTATPYYLEIPINIVFKKKISKSSSLFVGTGAYGAMGIAGNNKYAGSSGDFVYYTFSGNSNIRFEKSSNSFKGYYSTLKQFDYGINFLGGVEIKKIMLKINYGLGLTDVANNDYNKGKNAVLSFNIGYRIK